MELYFVVLYDDEPKTKAMIIPKDWILPKFDKLHHFGDRKYLFYHSDKNTQLPSLEVLVNSFIENDLEEKKDGFLYPGIILKGFGKTIENLDYLN